MTSNTIIVNENQISLEHQKLAVTDALAVKLTVPNGAKKCFITIEKDATATQDELVRFLETETDPDNSTGHLLKSGDTLTIASASSLKNLSFIGLETAKSHTLQITYYG